MIETLKDYRRMQYIIKLDYEDLKRAATNQDEYNNLICRISKAIYEEIRRTT